MFAVLFIPVGLEMEKQLSRKEAEEQTGERLPVRRGFIIDYFTVALPLLASLLSILPTI